MGLRAASCDGSRLSNLPPFRMNTTQSTRRLIVDEATVSRIRCSRWFAPVVLAIPFLAGIIALRGLTVTLPMFHGSDEFTYHYPTILRFGRELPFPNLANYRAAQTPLFHLVMAYIGKVIGYPLWRLRLVEAGISYGLAWAVFVLLHHRLLLPRLTALALTLLFVLSPYVYAASFRLMTDNLALLFSVLAVDRLERFRESRSVKPFLVASACIALAMLTRQSAAFLVGFAALYLLVEARRHTWPQRVAAAGAIGLACVPIGLLFLTWHGLTPPAGDTSSCGLCSHPGSTSTETGLSYHTAELAVAAVGLYGSILFLPGLLGYIGRCDHRIAAHWRAALLCAVAAAIALLILPADVAPQSGGVTPAAGLIWRIASKLPSVDGSSLLFWALVPLGVAVLWWRTHVAPRPWLVIAFFGCFLIGTLAVRLAWQKYVDPFVVLTLLMTVRPDEFSQPRAFLGAAGLAVAFVAYALTFVA
jgi:4-amino-4-deoxy-L-arabinose transferase-like glycosyltransferase